MNAGGKIIIMIIKNNKIIMIILLVQSVIQTVTTEVDRHQPQYQRS